MIVTINTDSSSSGQQDHQHRRSSVSGSGAVLVSGSISAADADDRTASGITTGRPPSTEPLPADDAVADSSVDGSDSGTAGSSSGQTWWPDLEVLDPDHPM